jgi:probable F420-dependent oxidoreductase
VRPFRFSLQAAASPSRTAWVELARKAEDLGFSLLVTADHLDTLFSPLAPLLGAAAATTTLRVGVLVLNNDFRHPALLAREAATIDLLSDGRLELGLGAGHARPEYERIGLSFDPPAVRVGRLAESVQILRGLLDGKAVTFAGEYYRLAGEQCYPRPAQAHVPLLVGGGGRRVLAIAARWADAVGFTGLGRTLADGNSHDPSGFGPAAVDEQVAWVRSQAGDRLGGLEFQALVQAVVPTDDPRQAAADLIAKRIPSLTVDDVLRTPYLMVGTTAALIDRLIEQRERWGFSHYTVRPDALDAVAPIVARLAGY